MIKITGSLKSIMDSIKFHLESNSENRINNIILSEILSCLKSVRLKQYASTEMPENFTKINKNSLIRNFNIPKFDFFIEFQTFFHDYIGIDPYRQGFDSAFLKITSNSEHYNKIKNILNHDDEKDLIIAFYKIGDEWKIPLFGFSYDYQKSNLIALFPVNKQKMDIEKENDFIKKETTYFIHYALEIYKKIIFINFNKNIDLIYTNFDKCRIPHIYLKKERELSKEDWLTIHKYDKDKFYHLNNIINYGIQIPKK